MNRFLPYLCSALAALSMTGCGQQAAQAPVRLPPEVTVSKPIEKDVVDNLYFEGYTAAVSTVDIRARVTGYLSKVYFKDGDNVKEGQPLFLIDPRPYQASLDQAQADEGRVEALLKRLQSDFTRAERLLPQKTISQEEFDRTAAERNQALADVRAKKAAVEQANLNLHFAAIKAPINGRISRTLVTEGNLVTANETLLTTIVTVDPIYAYFDVDEPTVLHIRQMIREGELESREKKPPVIHLGLDIDSGYPFKGTIDFVENRIDTKTGTLKVRAIFANKDEALAPGSHARIEMPLGKPHKELLISERAIGTLQGQKYVYVVNDKNEVVYRPVKLGSLDGHLRVVRSGIAADDRVITNGVQRVRAGVTVTPKDSEMTAAAGDRAALAEN